MTKLPGPLRELEQFRMTDGSGVIDLDRFLQTRGYHSFCSAHHDFMYDCERDDYCFTLYCWDRQGQHYASVNDSKVMYYQEFRSKAKFQQVRLAFWTREERDAQWLSIWEALENNVPYQTYRLVNTMCLSYLIQPWPRYCVALTTNPFSLKSSPLRATLFRVRHLDKMSQFCYNQDTKVITFTRNNPISKISCMLGAL